MLEIPVIRWGKPYDSIEKKEIRHFVTGEPIATVELWINIQKNYDLWIARKKREPKIRIVQFYKESTGKGTKKTVVA